MNSLEEQIIKYFKFLDAKGKLYNMIVGLVCTAAVGALDLIAPADATHSFLYLLPITFVTWFSGIGSGTVVLLICTALWSFNNISDSLLITYWNILSTLLFFTSIAIFLHKTRYLWESERKLLQNDPLTGARNLRAFSELAEHEMLSARRNKQPFSIAYIDIDNFKSVNDTFGHARGDEVLRASVSEIINNLRDTDLVGRLGGDELAIFFSATDQAAVRVIMENLIAKLAELTKTNNWPISYSVGVLTCPGGVYNLEKLISCADALMYEVKRAGKNNIRYAEYSITECGEQ